MHIFYITLRTKKKKSINERIECRKRDYKASKISRLSNRRKERLVYQIKGRDDVFKTRREQVKAVKIEVASIPRLISVLWHKGRRVQLHGIQHLRQILHSEPSAAVEKIISCNIVARFVEFLHLVHDPELQFEAVSCLKIISSKRPQMLFHYEALPILVRLVSNPSYKVSHEAIWTLGCVAASCSQWRNHVLSIGAFDPVVARLDKLLYLEESSMLKACSWTLASFCKGNILTAGQSGKALVMLKKLLKKQDDVVVGIACWAVHDISDGGVQALIYTGIYSELAYLLKNNGNYTPSVLRPMLLTLRNILEEDDTEFTDSPKIMSDALKSILSRNDKGLHKYVCDIISNLTVVGTTFIQCMLDNGIVDHLLEYLDMVAKRSIEARNKAKPRNPMKPHEIRVDELKDGEVDETCEAALALSHLASNSSSDQVRELVKRNCIKRLCYLLSEQIPRQDPRVVASCLDGIHHMLNAGEVSKEFETNVFTAKDKESIGNWCGQMIYDISARATTVLKMIQ